MLAKLRKRFILITMSLIGAVLLAVLAVSVISGYQTQLLLIQSSTAKAVGEGGDMRTWLGDNSGLLDSGRSSGDSSGEVGGGGGKGGKGAALPLPVYLVVIDNTTGFFIEQSNVAAMGEELLETALNQVAANNANSGFLTDLGLYYQSQQHNDGPTPVTRIAFADTTQLFSSTLQQAVIAVLIFAGAMLVFFFISLFLSKLTLRPVEQAWEQQRRFVADASHELKTPLTVILANNNIILTHPERPTSEQMQWLQSTQAEAVRMDGLVRDLLLLAQVEEQQEKAGEKLGGLLPRSGGSSSGASVGSNSSAGQDAGFGAQSELNLSTLVERSLLQFDAVFFERGITVKSGIEPGVNVVGNSEQLGRLLAILLDNASKYSAAKGTVDISLQAGETAGLDKKHQALLKVSNTGEAIAPEKLEHVFERFYRGDTSHSNTIEGSGLGLSLAKAIAEAHNGQISVESNASATTFYVKL